MTSTSAAPRPAGRLADRALALAGLAGLVWLQPALAARIPPTDRAQALANLTACALAGLALLPTLLTLRGPGSAQALAGALRRRPLAALAAATVAALLGLAALVVLREWGVLLVLLAGAAAWARLSLAPAAERPALAERLLLGGTLSGAVLLAGLALGEAWLRAHPERVGGGGGGNPALAVLHDGLYVFNELGLRGPAPRDEPRPPDLRVLAIGDSFTFGQAVAEADTWPAQLQRLLEARAPGRRHEVVNGGRPGLDTRGEVDWLRETGAGLRPDVVVAQFYVNDVIRHRPVGEGADVDWPSALVADARRHAWVLFHLQFRVSQWDLRRRAGRLGPADWLSVFARHVERADEAWLSCARALDDLGAWARETDTPTLLVLYPHPGPEHPGTATIHAAVAGRATAAGLECLDLAPRVGAIPPARQVAAPYDHHPSPELHAFAAAAIRDALERRGWLP